MKFFIPLALLVAAGVSAQDKKCDADYIVTRCLQTEQPKIQACEPLDYDCQCAAYQAVATCYDNCPKDARASPAKQQVNIMCQNASLYGSAAQASKTASVSSSQTSDAAAATTTAAEDSKEEDQKTSESSAAPPATTSADGTGAAANIARNTGGLLLAVAGVVAAVL